MMAHQPYRPLACTLPAEGAALPALLGGGALAVALCLIPLPGKAANFTPPQGCRLEATAQNRGCTVVQYYRCDADPKGDQRSASFDQDGISNLARIDSETRWIESIDPVSGLEDRLVENSADHASFDTLVKTGRDDFDFWTESNNGEKLRHVGHDELTGEMVSIDGVELEKTRFQLTTYAETGETLIERRGQQFISRATRRFYGGVETQSDWTGQHLESNDSPVLFSYPGENGFGDTTPQFDCDQLMTQLLQERAQL
jgi:hypothetical protein